MQANISQTNSSLKKSGIRSTVASGASRATTFVRGLSPWTWAATAAGGALVYAGIRAARANPDKPRRAVQFFQQCTTVECDATELSTMWRNPQVLDRVMQPFGSVASVGPDRLRWTFDIPVHGSLSGEAVKIEERPGELVHWRTAPGTPIQVDEWLLLSPKRGGTRVVLR
ncbi:MAG TPA: hypothetical protein VF786_15160, partial [Terriglobales bacterium]